MINEAMGCASQPRNTNTCEDGTVTNLCSNELEICGKRDRHINIWSLITSKSQLWSLTFCDRQLSKRDMSTFILAWPASLQRIRLQRCNLDGAQLGMFVTKLATSPGLIEVDLRDNPLNALAVSELISTTSAHLRMLDLGGSSILKKRTDISMVLRSLAGTIIEKLSFHGCICHDNVEFLNGMADVINSTALRWLQPPRLECVSPFVHNATTQALLRFLSALELNSSLVYISSMLELYTAENERMQIITNRNQCLSTATRNLAFMFAYGVEANVLADSAAALLPIITSLRRCSYDCGNTFLD